MGGALGAGDVCVQYMNVCVCVLRGSFLTTLWYQPPETIHI